MAAIVQRLQCAQLPEVSVLGIGSGPTLKYLVHAQQLIGLSLNKTARGTANLAMHTFFKNHAGMSMEQGGDLVTAFCRGPLTAKIYTHQLGVGATKPSFFVTIEGAKTILDALPNQDESVKQRLLALLRDHLLDQAKVTSCFQPASDDQTMMDDGYEEESNDYESAMTQFNARVSIYRMAADNKVLTAQLEAKEVIIKAKEAEATAEIAKERAEKEAAKKELQLMMESAAKDAKIMELQMKLIMAGKRADREEQQLKKKARVDEDEDEDDETITSFPRKREAAKTNWLVAYEADAPLRMEELFTNEFRGYKTIQLAGRWVSVLRLFQRKRFGFFQQKLANVYGVRKMWVEAHDEDNNTSDDFLDLSMLNENEEDEKKIKHYMQNASTDGKFPIILISKSALNLRRRNYAEVLGV